MNGDCEAAMTARAGYAWLKFREGEELLYGKIFPVVLMETAYRIFALSVVLYDNQRLYLNKDWLWILKRMDRVMILSCAT